MKTSRPILSAICLGVLLTFRAGAHPYASGVTNQGGVISWVLNEPATDVKIVFDNGTSTNDLGSSPVMGTNTFTLASRTNFSIVVFKVGSNTLNLISSDANNNNVIFGPRGVAVNRNPKTWNFGRIYVSSANPGLADEGRVCTRGIYALDAASEDCLGLVNTAATAGITFGTSTTFSPFKLMVGSDDSLYVGDAATSKIGGVWRVDPNLATSVALFGLANPSTNTTSKGTNFGRAVGTPNVTGSLAGGNLVLTLTSWDLNLTNSSGKFNTTATSYQNIYQYNIGATPLPYTNYPTVITNPIGIGTVNVVTMDAQVAPDGKYFITAGRSNPADGTTNVCVLNSAGTAVVWDSRTQSAAFFGDSVNDHLCMNNRSICVSPDDKFVIIQSSTNNDFFLMSLTNGVPDISTLTTNLTVATSGGTTCYAATWDAADNIYITSGGSQTLHILSPGMTTTCVTSNTASCTNGSFQFTATSAALPAIQTPPTNQTVQCSSNASFAVQASGAGIGYQWYLANLPITGATNATLNLGPVSVSQSGGNFKVVVSNSLNSVTSQVAVLTVVDTLPPVVTLNGNAIVSLLQGGTFTDPGATATDACAGSLPVTTNGAVNVNVAGIYLRSYIATDPSGNSASNGRAVYVQGTSGAPSIMLQPSIQVAQCTSPAVFSAIASGAMPLHYQWFDGSTALTDGPGISGSGGPTLTLTGTMLTQAGNFKVVVTNSSGSAASQLAALTVNDSTMPVVTVVGSQTITIAQGASFTDPGATATDPCSGALSVITNGSVNASAAGTYVLTYTATNGSGGSATGQRVVTVTPPPVSVSVATPNIIPLPVTLQNRPGIFTLCPSQPLPPVHSRALMQIQVDGASQQTGQYLAAALFKSTGYQFQVATSSSTNAVKNAILITTSNAVSTLGAEGYELTVAPDSVVIRAPAQGGTFYGVQSLLQLLPPQIYSPRIVTGVAWVAPCVYIEDQPLFPWRGVMLDVARHFFNKDQVKQVLDAMAMHKLNTFHWHLVDDQAWRLEMTNYPNLTVAGAFRDGPDYGLSPKSNTETNAAGQYGGYYTQAEAREIVAYAQERHITVVPEIEMPCHTTAALLAYPQFGCGNPVGDYDPDYPSINYNVDLYSLGTPGTIAFLQDALIETMGIFPSKYIHCGGDEVVASGDTQWNSYPPDVALMNSLGITPNGTTSIVAYQHYLSTNIAAFVQANGRMMMGWTEFENGGILTNAALMDWETGTSSQAVAVATNGMPVVMSPDASCYVNYVEGNSSSLPIEPPFIVGGAPAFLTVSNVYAFKPIPTNLPAAFATNILGAQCNLWGEYVPSFRNVMFKMFPRETAMAEITWTPTNLQSYTSFTNRLAVEEQRFTQMGLNYDHEAVPQIGSWGPAVSTTPTTVNYDITPYVTAAGEIDVNFYATSGANGLSISSVTLLQNGAPVDVDVHPGYTGTGTGSVFPVYIVNLPETKPGATYTIQAVVYGTAGTATSGNVYLPNWN